MTKKELVAHLSTAESLAGLFKKLHNLLENEYIEGPSGSRIEPNVILARQFLKPKEGTNAPEVEVTVTLLSFYIRIDNSVFTFPINAVCEVLSTFSIAHAQFHDMIVDVLTAVILGTFGIDEIDEALRLINLELIGKTLHKN